MITTYDLSYYISRIISCYNSSSNRLTKPWYTYEEIPTWSLLSHVVQAYYKDCGREKDIKEFQTFVFNNEKEFYFDLNYILHISAKRLKIRDIY